MAKRETVARKLGRALGGEWKAVRNGFGWYWACTDGRRVQKYAESVLTHDGYSDSEFDTVYLTEDGVKVGCNGVFWSNRLYTRPNDAVLVTAVPHQY